MSRDASAAPPAPRSKASPLTVETQHLPYRTTTSTIAPLVAVEAENVDSRDSPSLRLEHDDLVVRLIPADHRLTPLSEPTGLHPSRGSEHEWTVVTSLLDKQTGAEASECGLLTPRFA